RLPAIYPYRYMASAGGLISYGPEPMEQDRQAASYVDRILRGERPGELPVQTPTKYRLAGNLPTAKAPGLTPPPPLLTPAHEVIDGAAGARSAGCAAARRWRGRLRRAHSSRPCRWSGISAPGRPRILRI